MGVINEWMNELRFEVIVFVSSRTSAYIVLISGCKIRYLYLYNQTNRKPYNQTKQKQKKKKQKMVNQMDSVNTKKGSMLTDMNMIALFLLVLFVVFVSQHIFASIPVFHKEPTALMALLAGVITSGIIYVPVKYLFTGSRNMTDADALGISVLIGLVSSYFMVFKIEPGFPDIQSMALAIFLFYYHFDRSIVPKQTS